MRVDQVMDHNMRRRAAAKAPKEIRSIEVEKAENGGHTVTHRFQHGTDGPYHEAETHVFGKSEGSKLMVHLTEHLGIKDGEKEEGDGEAHANPAAE